MRTATTEKEYILVKTCNIYFSCNLNLIFSKAVWHLFLSLSLAWVNLNWRPLSERICVAVVLWKRNRTNVTQFFWTNLNKKAWTSERTKLRKSESTNNESNNKAFNNKESIDKESNDKGSIDKGSIEKISVKIKPGKNCV